MAPAMRAAVIAGPGRIRIEEHPVPAPAEGQILVRLAGCGVCASNLEPWAGPPWMRFPTPPGGLGHEGWGIVAAVGRGVSRFREGDPVAPLFQNSYADHDCGDAAMAVAIPPALRDRPFPAEPLGCAVNIFARSGIEAAQTVAIVGCGFIGVLLVQLAVGAGARVIALSRREDSLAAALAAGAHHAIATDDPQAAVERVRALTGERLCECVIEATGLQGPLDLAAKLAGVRGRLVIAGYHQNGPRTVDMQMWNWRGIDVVNAHERDPAVAVEGMRRAADAVAAGLLDPYPLYTHRFALDELDRALDTARDRPPGFMKALVLT